jgi:hypothetical protein
VLIGAALLAACGGSIPPPPSSSSTPSSSRADLPNVSQIEVAIASSVLAKDHIRVKVLCPAIVPEISGETFSCVVVAIRPRPRTLTFLVTEHGGTYVTYAQSH